MRGDKATSPGRIRHRLLEGILLRLARLPDADGFVLRGGMLMRLWFRPLPRPAADLDLVGTFPFSVEQTAQRFRRLLAEGGVDDGVSYDTERFRAGAIWANTDFPGVRIFACGEIDGVEGDFSVDVTFGEPLVPRAELGDYPTCGSGLTARLWMCRPETITGRKLQALVQMGMLRWRPKDLNDLRLLLSRVVMNPADLPEAIALSFTSRGHTLAEARAVFGQGSWWSMKLAAARWQEFARRSSRQKVPENLEGVVAEVSGRLQPILEQLR